MRSPNETQRIEQAVALFRKFITVSMDIDSLADKLDELQMEYGCMLIDKEDVGYKSRADKFFMLYELKCICKLKDLDAISG